ncbi:MAG: 16S rRNA (guanine(527)-N(7))-methyltransferase RsmG [Holosporaceae bacterium]|jgi:16S rRNA (guanine527-N7)-methyltransferase|nr:16S rRNA (guanine(527)-N(7))-methyltransferase RsmG [Holosporaceae bacterium]
MFQQLQDLFNVSRETYDKLEIYQQTIIRWQRGINIVSRETIDDFWNRHIVDSLQIAEFIKGRRVLDIGSGGGFPGMVLAMSGNFDVTCVESDTKKSIFLEEIARLTRTSVKIENVRIENFNDIDFDTVIARGFAPLADLVLLVSKYSRLGYGVFPKGAAVQTEIRKAAQKRPFTYSIMTSKSDPRGSLVAISLLTHPPEQPASP